MKTYTTIQQIKDDVNGQNTTQLIFLTLNNKNMKTASCYVTIGKSKSLIQITFWISDFIKIEGDFLVLKNENRRLKISEESKRQLLIQLNEL